MPQYADEEDSVNAYRCKGVMLAGGNMWLLS